ncbi:unnamed protein product [Rotaria socialis]|uniref:NAD(P)(+)--arginine ADP-ribosyltransferase n=3 Tax=Rotaria socialis TaxID=392032 RepID=A0A817XG24_9BILA|nr:unnamed protein product [Rotaria socialis]
MGTGGESQAHRSRVSDVNQEPLKMLLPIRGYDSVPLVTLEKAVEPLVSLLPDIQDYVYVAKQRCDEEPADGLSQDESAAIMLYSMEWTPRDKCLYYVLNIILRSEDRRKLESWFLYLKLFLSGLTRLPTIRRFVYRGVKLDLSKHYKKGKLIVWWAFSSCTSTVEVLQHEDFLGQTGARTMFTIECDSGKDISQHSYFQSEEEILLPPARQFEVVASLQMGPDVHVIQLKEVKPPIVLLEPVSLTPRSNKSTSEDAKKDKPHTGIDDVKIKVEQMKIVPESTATTPKTTICVPNIPANAKWAEKGITVAGGNGSGNALNQLHGPSGVFVDNDQVVYVADTDNHRIVEWKVGTTSGQVIAGGNGKGNRADQLNSPYDVFVDKETDSLIISDTLNGRVVRWPRANGTIGETIIDNISCVGVTMDDHRSLYVSDWVKHLVRQYNMSKKTETVVAGGNRGGDHLNQLNTNTYVFVDQDTSIYVSDKDNHRVVKWTKGAQEGTIVAGGQGKGNALTQLSNPHALFVDKLGTVYIADYCNSRVMRWSKGAASGDMIVGGTQLSTPRGLSFDQHGNLWAEKGITVAGGNGFGNALNQLNGPYGLCVDDDQNIYIADTNNHRILQWKAGAANGQVVAGGNGPGNGADQLNTPFDMIIDKEMGTLIICDTMNRRVVRWSQTNMTSGETIIENICCVGLMMDDRRFLYISDWNDHSVRQYSVGNTTGTAVAGGNGAGDHLKQLNSNMFIFVDQDNSIYVSDYKNDRVVKWAKGAHEGIVVAGGHGKGDALTQLSHPQGVFVDQLGTVYVVDYSNHRVMRWCKGASEGTMIIGGQQLCAPRGISFDQHGNLYLADWGNNRVQRFSIQKQL